jgi:hypothetical protein
METEVTTLTAAAAMATVIVEPENLSRMLASLCRCSYAAMEFA